MKYLKLYNESLRDQMKPKSKQEILDSALELGLENTIVKMIDYEEWNGSTSTNPENIDNIKLLLDNGADVSHMNYIVLRYACTIGNIDFVEELFDKYNVPVNASDGIALTTAAEQNHPELLKYIIKRGGDVEKYGDEAVEYTIDQALNNQRPIISECVLILVENGISKDKIKVWLEYNFSDESVNNIMKELDEKLNKYNGSE